MSDKRQCRTRFAPSPTGMIHIGNLRSALYAYLLARSEGGKFVLRIEDTDRDRLVEGAVEKIYDALRICGMDHDEGPDIGGPYAPYVQSERKDQYLPEAKRLVDEGSAYYCFCSKERLEKLAEDGQMGYDRHCRDLAKEEVEAKLEAGEPYVIRQKMPIEGETTFHDEVFGDISVDNKELEDQILIKSDGYPTYNFANVIDDHAMGITHVLRGSEYLSSTPKYQLLYRAFGWDEPVYVHLPLILGEDGKKLSKRHGATSLEDLIGQGYLPAAIVNYIAFLGWSPGNDTREIFSLEELEEIFSTKHIGKAPAIFDYEKLDWVNKHYVQELPVDEFEKLALPYYKEVLGEDVSDIAVAVLNEVLQNRISKFSEIPEMIHFLKERPELTPDLFFNKKQKLNVPLAIRVLETVIPGLEGIDGFARDDVHAYLMGLGEEMELKTGQVMGPPRLAVAGQKVTPGGTTEMLMILGKEKALARLKSALDFLHANNEEA